MDYTDRNVVVLGSGVTGLSLARHLTRHGAKVRVADTRAAPPHVAELAALQPNVTLTTGPFTAQTLAGAELIAISPGVARGHPAIAAATARGVELAGDIELFAKGLPPEQKVLFRDLERAYANTHLERLAGQTVESIETSSLHLDLISDLRRINSHFCSIAYPILEEAGVLAKTRLKEPDPVPQHVA